MALRDLLFLIVLVGRFGAGTVWSNASSKNAPVLRGRRPGGHSGFGAVREHHIGEHHIGQRPIQGKLYTVFGYVCQELQGRVKTSLMYVHVIFRLAYEEFIKLPEPKNGKRSSPAKFTRAVQDALAVKREAAGPVTMQI